MSDKLIIVESPAKANTIKKFLGGNTKVVASMGHIRDLPKSKMGVDTKTFEPQYINIRGKGELIKALKKDAKDAKKIYLATDPDREGEAIAWHLANILGINEKETCRVTFNEITKEAVKDAVKNPRTIDMDLTDAQQARRVLDRILGYKMSPVLWKKVQKGLSAGRVQSVALRLICEIDEEIKAFIPEEYWTIEVEFWKDKLPPIKAVLHSFDGKKVDLKNEEQSMAICNDLKDKKGLISSYKKSERDVQPPAPYITSTLQQDASRLLNFNAKKTMMIAQQLYEGLDIEGETLGLITYMRTDSVRISNEANDSLRDFIEREYGKNKLIPKQRVFANKNAAQDAHEAIRPTFAWRTPEDLKKYLSKDQQRLYDLIWRRFTATQLIPMRLSTVSLEIECGKGLF